MTIRGLPKNDPFKEQYQLWIIDPSRDDEPIDGGVFDISADAESVIPINAKLMVGNPKVFAVTVEKPGGVVVSDQKRLPLIAKVDI
jgi:anti-sigma-K factor RskA